MPTELAVYDHEQASVQFEVQRLHDIEQQERIVQKAEDAWKDSQALAKARKEAFDVAVSRMRQLIRERDGAPLFINTNETSIDHESWRDTLVSDLGEHGLTIQVVQSLEDAGLKTLGQVADWTAGGKSLTDIKGIGAAKSEAIENCMVKWFAANPTQRPPVGETEQEETAEAED